MNTKQRGDVAVGQAIAYYLGLGFEVCLPIGDKRPYDFLIEKDKEIQRIQVKYAGLSNRGKCVVGLRITGGNQSYNYARNYKDDDFDVLFVYTARNERFAVPWPKVECRNEVSIESSRYSRYKIGV